MTTPTNVPIESLELWLLVSANVGFCVDVTDELSVSDPGEGTVVLPVISCEEVVSTKFGGGVLVSTEFCGGVVVSAEFAAGVVVSAEFGGGVVVSGELLAGVVVSANVGRGVVVSVVGISVVGGRVVGSGIFTKINIDHER